MTRVMWLVICWWVAVALAYYVTYLTLERRRMRRVVFANLDSARDNGYFAPGEYLFAMSTDELAVDLACFAEDCEGVAPRRLKPHIIAWERSRGFRNWEN